MTPLAIATLIVIAGIVTAGGLLLAIFFRADRQASRVPPARPRRETAVRALDDTGDQVNATVFPLRADPPDRVA